MTRATHLGLWLGGTGGLLAAAVAASLLLTGPGVAVAGAPVGLSPRAVAERDIGDRLARVQVHLGEAVLTGSQLGASVDARALAQHAIATHPLWNVAEWNPAPQAATVTIDPRVALPALQAAMPQLFSDPVDARVVFSEETNRFAVLPARPGTGVDVDDLASQLGAKLTTGATSVTLTPKSAPAEAAATTRAAEAFAARLNTQAAAAGFYVQGERALAVSPATVASWLTIAADPRTGRFTITPDQTALDRAVTGLPGRIERQAQNETVVTNSAGKRLRVTQEGRPGFRLADTVAGRGAGSSTSAHSLAALAAASLTDGNLAIALPGEVLPARTTTVFRRIEVDTSAGMTYLYEGPASGREKRIASYPVAIGTGGAHETRAGRFTVNAQLTMQDMGDCTTNKGFGYCTKNVPWVSYFNGDQAFHGTYWHDNFGAGARMSHGCVNMRIADAERLYRFAQIGTEVWVHE